MSGRLPRSVKVVIWQTPGGVQQASCAKYGCICCVLVSPDAAPEAPPACDIARRADDDGREPGEILQSAATVVQRAAAAVLSGSSTDEAAAPNPKMRVRSFLPEPIGFIQCRTPKHSCFSPCSLPFVRDEALDVSES